jgi:hypothetical protein
METGPRLRKKSNPPAPGDAVPVRDPVSFRGFAAKSTLMFYLPLSLLLFGRCLFFHQAYFDSDLLAQFGPWRAFLKDQLAQGHFPLWNPYLLGGQPFFADLQNMMLYPPNYLTLPFSIPFGLTLFIALHWLGAALGMRAWLSLLGLGERACRVGSLLFALSGFFWIELIHPTVLAAFAWLPWWFARLEILVRDPKPRAAFWAGLVFALLFLSGSFQVFLGAFYGGLGYFVFRWVQNREKWPPLKNPRLWRVALFFIAGSFPIWAQFIPTQEFVSFSNRNAAQPDYGTFNASRSLNPQTLLHGLFPTRDLPEGQFLDHALQNNEDFLANELYLGVWAPFLGLLAFYFYKKFPARGTLWFFLLAGLATLGLCFGGYFILHPLVTKFVPGFSSLRAPFRFSYFWAFSFSTLAAWGWQSLESLPTGKKPSRFLLYAVFLYGALLLGVALVHPERTVFEIAALGVGGLGFAMVLQKRYRMAGLTLLEAALLIPLLLRGWQGYAPAPISNFNFAANSKALVGLVTPQMPSRVFMDPRQVPYPIKVRDKLYVSYYPENVFAALRLKDFGGYNPLSLKAVNDLRFLPSDKIFKLMAIRGFATGNDAGDLAGFKKQRQDYLYFYQSLFSGSLVFAPRRWEVLEGDSDQITRMGQAAFDPYQQGVLSEPLPASIAERLEGKPANLHYDLRVDTPSAQSFQLSLSADSLVVFSEVNYPGWQARVDGAAVPLETADHILRALFLSAGTHTVDFTYQPWWGPWIAAPWILCALVGFWLVRKKDF